LDDLVKDRLESEEKENIDQTEKEDIPQDLCSMWTKRRLLYFNARTSQDRYNCLKDCLELGIAMLPDEEQTLREKATALISQIKQYLGSRDVEYEAVRGVPTYRITGENIGKIVVRPEDFEKGQQEAINQNCDRILPKITEIESEVMIALVKHGILVPRKWEPEDLFTDRYYKKLQARKKAGVKPKDNGGR